MRKLKMKIIFARKHSDYKTLETNVVIVLALQVFWFLFHFKVAYYLSIGILITAVSSKKYSGIIAESWLKLTRIIGGFNTKIILFAVFYMLVVPLAYLYRMASGDFLDMADSGDKTTLWHDRNHCYEAQDMVNLW